MPDAHARAYVARRLILRGTQVVMLGVGFLVLVLATRAVGVHWTLTASVPRGVYQRTHDPLVRGTLVAFCLPLPHAEFGWQRGYIAGVPNLPLLRECPSGYQPLLKPIAAVAGDVVDVMPDTVRVNGKPIAHSQTQDHDRAGRVLPHVPWGRYVLTAGELWVMSTYHPLSWD